MPHSVPSIAIVDDDRPVLKALKRLLHRRGFDAITYESAQVFLDALPRSTSDCLIVDLQMPDMNGLDLHQTLVRRGIRIPTIIITAHGGEGARDRCIAAGVRQYLN
jgi:FixJ family two-component response regulator